MIHESRAIANEGETLELDPFAFWPDRRSRLLGLGGSDEGDNPDYVFHTLYTSCGTGPIVFTVTFEGLEAARGTLIMRVHELPEVMGAHARQTAISQTQLIDLIRGDGRVSLPATARAGNNYALLGHIHGDTVATAQRVTVELSRRTPEAEDPATPTRYHAGSGRIGTIPQIVGQTEGTLVTPVTQLCTARQLKEPVLEMMLAQMGGLPGFDAIDRWEHAYLARVLDRYDAARPGARGLGVGALHDPLSWWTAAQGCTLLLTSPHPVPPDVDLPPHSSVRELDPLNVQGLAGFDFAWATRSGGVRGADRQVLLRFIEDVLAALKPGGLLTLVVPFDVAPRVMGDDAGPLIRRPDIDRIVLLLLSRGHQVAQICPLGEAVAAADETETLMISAFGLVVRRAS